MLLTLPQTTNGTATVAISKVGGTCSQVERICLLGWRIWSQGGRCPSREQDAFRPRPHPLQITTCTPIRPIDLRSAGHNDTLCATRHRKFNTPIPSVLYFPQAISAGDLRHGQTREFAGLRFKKFVAADHFFTRPSFLRYSTEVGMKFGDPAHTTHFPAVRRIHSALGGAWDGAQLADGGSSLSTRPYPSHFHYLEVIA